MSRPIEEAGDYFCLHHSAFQQKVNGREGAYNENDGKKPCSGSSKLIFSMFGSTSFHCRGLKKKQPVKCDTLGGKQSIETFANGSYCVCRRGVMHEALQSEEYKWRLSRLLAIAMLATENTLTHRALVTL